MENKEKNIEYYYKNNRFFSLFKDTKKHKELWKSKEALISLILSLLITAILYLILFHFNDGSIKHSITEEAIARFLEAIRPVVLTVLGGLFSLLGFTISGLALLTGTISTDVISKIREANKIKHLMSVIFNFYFCGAIIGVTLVLSIITYLITYIKLPFDILMFIFWALIYSHFIIFSIIYSVMLLGTSIRLFLLKYFYVKNT